MLSSASSTRILTAALLFAWGAAIAADLGVAPARQRKLPAGEAQWIWAQGPWDWRPLPAAFYAACDFDLPSPAPAARLLFVADEEAILHVNGRLVASATQVAVDTSADRAGAELQIVALGDRVRAGGNRIIVELRSGRGAGGFLATLDAGLDGAPTCATGPGWRIFRTSFPGFFEGWALLARGESPHIWGPPPIGRWGAPRLGGELPRWDLALAGMPPRPAVRVQAAGRPDWRPLTPDGRLRGAAGSDLTLDWGEEVSGMLRLVLRDPEAEPASAAKSPRQPGPPSQKDDEVAAIAEFSALPPAPNVTVPVALVPGERAWRDSRPRRFRFVRVVGTADVVRAEVIPVPPQLMPPPAPSPRGILGFPPPPLRLPVEDEIHRRRTAPAQPSGGN